MKKKTVILLIVIILFILMLIPIKHNLKDGGSVEYKAVLYKYTKIHRINENSITGYEDGWELKILGIHVGGEVNDYVDANKNSKFTLVFKEGTITKTTATIILKNNTGEDYTYGVDYYFKKNVNGKWEDVETVTDGPLSWTLDEHIIKSGEEVDQNINWNFIYGELPIGEYQIVKKVYKASIDIDKVSEGDQITVVTKFEIK